MLIMFNSCPQDREGCQISSDPMLSYFIGFVEMSKYEEMARIDRDLVEMSRYEEMARIDRNWIGI